MAVTRAVAFSAVLALLLLAAAADTTDAGEAVYKAYCVSCHGVLGDASTPAGRKLKAADLRSEEVQKKSNEELFNTIAYGFKHKQYPHAFAARGLTDKQIADVLICVRRFAKGSRSGKRP